MNKEFIVFRYLQYFKVINNLLVIELRTLNSPNRSMFNKVLIICYMGGELFNS